MQIQGHVAIITGGASGLGEAATREIVAQGGKVVIFDRDENKGTKLAEALGDDVLFHACDVSDEDQVKAGIAKAEKLGELRIAFNAAGIGAAQKTVGKDGAHDFKRFKKVVEVNLFGTFNVVRLAAEAMGRLTPVNEKGERGVIINTASIAAFEGQQGQAAYAASKGGVVSMTLPIARDLARIGVRINTIAPGLFETPMIGAPTPEMIEMLSSDVEFPKRLGEPKEIAHLVRAIIENTYLNGETIRCDGAARLSARWG